MAKNVKVNVLRASAPEKTAFFVTLELKQKNWRKKRKLDRLKNICAD